MKSKNKHALLTYLKSQHTMSLATYYGKPWVCTVFYAIDKEFNIYYIGPSDSRHNKTITTNKLVALSIADTRQTTTDKKVGVQIEGEANEVKSRNKIKLILSLWNKTNPGLGHVINLSNIIKKVIKSHVYQVKPGFIKFFNEKLYGPEGVEIFKF